MAFTPAEVAQIKAYLGYPVVGRVQLLDHGMLPAEGRPTAGMVVLDYNIERVSPEAEPIIRAQMARIACVVGQVAQSYGMQQVTAAGGVTFAGLAGIMNTNTAYVLETDKLADLLNTPKCQTSLLHERLGGSGRGAVNEPC